MIESDRAVVKAGPDEEAHTRYRERLRGRLELIPSILFQPMGSSARFRTGSAFLCIEPGTLRPLARVGRPAPFRFHERLKHQIDQPLLGYLSIPSLRTLLLHMNEELLFGVYPSRKTPAHPFDGLLAERIN